MECPTNTNTSNQRAKEKVHIQVMESEQKATCWTNTGTEKSNIHRDKWVASVSNQLGKNPTLKSERDI